MKKTLLLLLATLLVNQSLKSQALTFTLGSGSPVCYSSSNFTTNASWSSFPAGATTASWSIVSSTCSASYTTVSFSNISCNFPCVGNYTVNCSAYNSSNVLLSSYSRTLAVLASPQLSILGPSVGICTGGSILLTASGANTYSWTNGPITSTNLVTPTVSTCYSVTGLNANGCSALASICVSLFPLPSLSVSPSVTVCLGSSAIFTVSGAVTYTWSNGSIGNTVNVLPTSSAVYSVMGINANGCIKIDTVAVTVNTACAIVWPGDANRDGQVDNTDVFELGLAASSTGPARTSTSIAWSGQQASAWTGTISTGWNKAHADCNGDGVVNSSDNLAISANFSLTHAFKGPAATNADIKLVATNTVANAGQWNKLDIMLGDATNNINQLFGVAFDIDYDKTMIQSDSVKLVYTASFLNAANQNIDFQKAYFANGKVYGATVRTNGTDVSGNGKIGELMYKVKSGLSSGSVINFGLNNGKKVSNSGVKSVLGTTGPISLTVNGNPSGITTINTLNQSLRFYPNPAKSNIVLESDLNTVTTFRLLDLSGRLIISGEFTNSKTLDVAGLAKGAYLLNLESTNGKLCKKVMID